MNCTRIGCGVRYVQILALMLAAVSVAAQTAPRITQPVDNSRRIALPGNVSPWARPQFDKGAAPAALSMERMLLVLKRSPEKETALQSLLASQHDPRSPNFHRWLTPDQFGKKFGPGQSDVSQVTAWLAQNGLKVTDISRGRTVIEFSGSSAQVQQAFRTSIHQYQINGKTHWANTSSPQIPLALAPVVAGVASLNSFTKHPTSRLLGLAKALHAGGATKIVPVEPNYSASGSNYLSPGDFWTIYNAKPLITASSNPIDGTGQTIAIAGRSDVRQSDIVGFRSVLLPPPYSSTLPFNQINNGPDPGSVEGDNLENSLDVEWASALAPGATLDLVVSQTTATTDGVDLSELYIVDNNLAPVMSSSYSLCEAALGAAENQFLSNLWEQAAAQGITSMVSAGDNGSAGCDNQNASGDPNNPSVAFYGLQVNGLASTPYNVAVGGNELTNDSSAYWGSNQSNPPYSSALSYIPEAVWNESCSPNDSSCGGPANASLWAGSGGASGCLNATFDSNFNLVSCQGAYAKPSWQSGVIGIPNDGVRDLPDVSFTAAGHDGYIICFDDPNTDPGGTFSCQNGYFAVVGGTSASTPAFAGVMGLVNQKAGSRQGQANYVLYSLAAAEYGSTTSPDNGNLTSCNSSNGNAVGTSCTFYDVTAGTNAVPCAGGSLNCSATASGTFGTLTGYSATPGYDQATGLGSINIANLVNGWSSATGSAIATTTTLSVSPTSGSLYGQAARITITVKAASAGPATGDVALVTNSTDPNSQGVARVTLTNGAFSGTVDSLPAGAYTLYARYAGNLSFASSVSAGVAISVNRTRSVTVASVLATDPVTGSTVPANAVPYGSNVVIATTVKGIAGLAIPTGNMAFMNGSTTLDTALLDGSGNASYAKAAYVPTQYSFVAQYSGDDNYNASLASLRFNVVKATPTLMLISTQGVVVGSGTATVTARVQTHSFQTAPSGTVTFFINKKVVGSVPPTSIPDPMNGASDAAATMTILNIMLTAGPNSITAVYSGDGNYGAAAASAAVNINYAVSAVPNTLLLTASPRRAEAGQTITLTATATTAGFTASGGTVVFYDGTNVLGRIQVVGPTPAHGFVSGTATLKVRLGPGHHSITAAFGVST